VITPVGQLVWDGGAVGSPEAQTGPVAAALRETLVGIQYGRIEDTHGWMHRLA
jgi:branched-chain amino acid aminotransferase